MLYGGNAQGFYRDDTGAYDGPNWELMAFGAGNVASGVFGGLPLTYSRSRAAALLASGAVSHRAAAVCALVTGSLLVVGGR